MSQPAVRGSTTVDPAVHDQMKIARKEADRTSKLIEEIAAVEQRLKKQQSGR